VVLIRIHRDGMRRGIGAGAGGAVTDRIAGSDFISGGSAGAAAAGGIALAQIAAVGGVGERDSRQRKTKRQRRNRRKNFQASHGRSPLLQERTAGLSFGFWMPSQNAIYGTPIFEKPTQN